MHACNDAILSHCICQIPPDIARVNAGEYWTSADIVDCIVSYTVTQLMDMMTDSNSREGAEMLARVSSSLTLHTCIKDMSVHRCEVPQLTSCKAP